MIPASNQKLLVAAVALEMLGIRFPVHALGSVGPPAGRRRDRRRRLPDRWRRSAADLVGLPDRQRQPAGDQRDDVRPARRRARRRRDHPDQRFGARRRQPLRRRVRGRHVGRGRRRRRSGTVRRVDGQRRTHGRTIGPSGPTPTRGPPASSSGCSATVGSTVGGSWGVGVADPAARRDRFDPVGAARRRGRRDAHHQRRQHRRDAAQGVRGSRDAASGTRTAGLERARSHTALVGGPDGRRRPLDGSGLSLANRVTCAAILAVLRALGGDAPAGRPAGRRRERDAGGGVPRRVRWRADSSPRPARSGTSRSKPTRRR